MHIGKINMRCWWVALLLWPALMSMGDTTQTSVLKEPSYAELEEGEELYDGTVKDEGVVTELKQVSFFGHTKVGGVRQEPGDAVTRLDLGKIKSIKVLQEIATSKKYPEKDFCEIAKTSLDGTTQEILLVPRHVVICGIDKTTGDEKAWYLNKIDELMVEKAKEPSLKTTDIAAQHVDAKKKTKKNQP